MHQKKEESTLKRFVDEGVIKPKFKLGQYVFTVSKYSECVEMLEIMHIRIDVYRISKYNSLVYYARRLRDENLYGYMEEDLFLTSEEAELKLKEILNENN